MIFITVFIEYAEVLYLSQRNVHGTAGDLEEMWLELKKF